MILLVSKAHGTLVRDRGGLDAASQPHVGRLLHPLDTSRVQDSLDAGLPMAADNRAFVGFEADKFVTMLDKLAGLPMLFVAAPDVVGDAAATDALWGRWVGEITARGLTPAYVAQDGLVGVPADAGAVFIGGSTEFKLGPAGERACREAKRRGLWLHVGRVNGMGRIAYCKTVGADSVDGTQWSMFTSIYLAGGAAACSAGAQLRLGSV